MKITCPKCRYVIDAGDVPDTLLPLVGNGILSVRCPRCASEIELTALTATLHYAGRSSTATVLGASVGTASTGTIIKTAVLTDPGPGVESEAPKRP